MCTMYKRTSVHQIRTVIRRYDFLDLYHFQSFLIENLDDEANKVLFMNFIFFLKSFLFFAKLGWSSGETESLALQLNY